MIFLKNRGNTLSQGLFGICIANGGSLQNCGILNDQKMYQTLKVTLLQTVWSRKGKLGMEALSCEGVSWYEESWLILTKRKLVLLCARHSQKDPQISLLTIGYHDLDLYWLQAIDEGSFSLSLSLFFFFIVNISKQVENVKEQHSDYSCTYHPDWTVLTVFYIYCVCVCDWTIWKQLTVDNMILHP
jgi:hypothetical protein